MSPGISKTGDLYIKLTQVVFFREIIYI